MFFHKKAERRFMNAKGFSLSEMMVSMGISAIISLAASFAFIEAVNLYVRMIRQYEAEVEMSSLMLSLRTSFSTASYVRYGGVASAANNATTNRPALDQDVSAGWVFSISDATVPGGGTIYGGEAFMVGMFNREMRVPVGASVDSLVATQIVYQRPNAAGLTSGAIYVDSEYNNVAPGNGWVRLSPVNAASMFTRLTNFELNNLKVSDADGSMVNVLTTSGNVCGGGANNCVGRPVVSAEVTAVMRYFTKGRQPIWKWCNSARAGGVPACTMNEYTQFYDVERKMNVVFVNNALQRDEYLPRRPFGNIYFGAPWFPLKRTQ